MPRRRKRRPDLPAIDIAAIGRRIREHLDSDLVVRTAAEEIRAAMRASTVTVWLTTRRDEPRRVHQAGLATDRTTFPKALRKVLRGWRPAVVASDEGTLVGAPILAPRSGLLGVVTVEGIPADRAIAASVAEIGREAGYALENANLYEQALARRDRSEAILNRVGDAIVVTDVRGTLLEWNPAAEWTLGLPAIPTQGLTCDAAIGLHAGERALDCRDGCPLLAEAGSAGGLGREVWRQRSDGRRQPLLANVATVADAEGAVLEVIHSLRDVTRIKEADEAKTMFLATASHELKTPLTVIQGFAQYLTASEGGSEVDRRRALEAIERRASQLNRIIERLLLSSRIEAGRAEIQVASLDVAAIVEDEVRSISSSTGRTITFEASGSLPHARADTDAVATIVEHLLDNAIKYSPGGEPIAVVARAEEEHLLIEITDRGIGMDPEQIAHCFERFWQGESSDVRRFGGTGIGLYIVRSLAEAMDGSAEVESRPGKGSTFRVRLRRADAEAPTAPAPEHEQEPEGEPSVIREFMRQLGIPAGRLP